MILHKFQTYLFDRIHILSKNAGAENENKIGIAHTKIGNGIGVDPSVEAHDVREIACATFYSCSLKKILRKEIYVLWVLCRKQKSMLPTL